jgi:O-antigen ligase
MQPRMGIYYLVLVFPLQTLRYDAQVYPFGSQIIDLVLLGVVIGMFLRRGTPLFAEMPMKGLIVVFAAWWYWSLWYGSYLWGFPWPVSISDPRFSNWKCIVEMGVLAFVTFAVIKTKEQIGTVLVLMCASALYVAFDFYQVMSVRDLSHFSDEVRYNGLIGYAGVNGLAAFAAGVGALMLGFYNSKLPRLLKIGVPVLLFACLYVVLFAFSRGAYLAFATGALFIGLAKRSVAVVVVFVSLLALCAVIPGVSGRVGGTFTQSDSSTEGTLDTSAYSRILVWQDATELIKEHPLLGTGFDSYHFMHRVGSLEDTHNYYLKVWLEEGSIGLLLFLALLGAMVRQGYTLFRSSSDRFLGSLGLGFAACMVVAAVANFFGDRWTFQQIVSYWWILLAVTGRAQLLASEVKVESHEAAPSLEPVAV